MLARRANDLARDDLRYMDEEVAEVSLLLPSSHVAALQERAQREGLTAGQLLRRLVRNHCLVQRPAIDMPDTYWG
jgi:hypothetical protein